MKENFGFIKHAVSENEFFFHYSELREVDPRDLDRGSEVEFGAYYDSRTDKTMGVRVIPLPKGTIKTEELVQTDVEGVVLREMREKRSYDRGAKRELYGGVVRLSQEDKNEHKDGAEGEGAGAGASAEGGDSAGAGEASKTAPGAKKRGPKIPEWQFGGDDVAPGEGGRPYTPAEGDVVAFDVVKVLATKQEKATNVRFVRAAPVPELERESGFVEKVAKDSYGFIECCDRDDRLFFHFSEFTPRNHQVAPGDEVHFVVSSDNQGRHTATHIVLQPKGTVTRIQRFEGVRSGVVERAMRMGAKKMGYSRERPELTGGVINMEEPAEEEGGKPKIVKVGFDAVDLVDGVRGLQPQPGDMVEFSLALDKPKRKKFAQQVRVTALSTKGREMGVVTKVKDGLTYCFIRCVEREGGREGGGGAGGGGGGGEGVPQMVSLINNQNKQRNRESEKTPSPKWFPL